MERGCNTISGSCFLLSFLQLACLLSFFLSRPMLVFCRLAPPPPSSPFSSCCCRCSPLALSTHCVLSDDFCASESVHFAESVQKHRATLLVLREQFRQQPAHHPVPSATAPPPATPTPPTTSPAAAC